MHLYIEQKEQKFQIFYNKQLTKIKTYFYPKQQLL
jgi:hypothetical protein